MERETVIDKLQKLIAHERSARTVGNIAEAEAFAAKIQQLLTTHKLEMSEIEIQEREESEPVGEARASPVEAGWRRTGYRVEWQTSLASDIAKANGCQLLVLPGCNIVFFVGRDSDRNTAKTMFLYMLEMARNLAEIEAVRCIEIERCKCYERWGLQEWRNMMGTWMKQFRESFAIGFAGAVGRRIYLQYQEMVQAERQRHGEQSTGLVLINRDALAVQDYLSIALRDNKPWTEKQKKNRRNGVDHVNVDAYMRGKRAGGQVALTSNRLSGQRDAL